MRNKKDLKETIIMANIERPAINKKFIGDLFNMSDDEFIQFSSGQLDPMIAQFEAEKKIEALLLSEQPRYSLDEFESYYRQQISEDKPAAQGTPQA